MRARGLKLGEPLSFVFATQSRPMRARGLKLDVVGQRIAQRSRAPCGRVG